MPVGPRYEREHPPKVIPPRPQRDRPDGGSFLAGSEGFNVSAAVFLCPLTSFAGVVRAGCGGAAVPGFGDAVHSGCLPERGRGGGPRGPAAPVTPLNERFVLQNTHATLRKRGRGRPPASQRRSLAGGGASAGGGGSRLPWCHTSGCPWKYDPMPWPTKDGQTWKPPRRATELWGKEDTVREHAATTAAASWHLSWPLPAHCCWQPHHPNPASSRLHPSAGSPLCVCSE